MTLPVKMSDAYFVQIKGVRTPVLSLKAASELWCAQRDAANLGAAQSPSVHVLDWRGRHVGYVSYNGRIWAGWPRDWQAGDKPIYDNRG